jgi:hypothetical protein
VTGVTNNEAQGLTVRSATEPAAALAGRAAPHRAVCTVPADFRPGTSRDESASRRRPAPVSGDSELQRLGRSLRVVSLPGLFEFVRDPANSGAPQGPHERGLRGPAGSAFSLAEGFGRAGQRAMPGSKADRESNLGPLRRGEPPRTSIHRLRILTGYVPDQLRRAETR